MISFEGKKHPIFHLDNCLFCYLCAENCPKKAITDTGCFELATTNKAELSIDPQICTYSIKIQSKKESQEEPYIGTYKKKNEPDFGTYKKKMESED